MGDPRRPRKKYKGPSHPWQKTRIEQEKKIKDEYGLKNKKEIWKFTSKITRLNRIAKRIIAERNFNEQAKKEEKQVLGKLHRQGIVEKDAKIEDVLGVDIRKFLDRRLQTFILKKGMAKTAKQARQLITHGHISLDNKKITVPSYIVTKEDESKISFNQKSSFSNPEHPERKVDEKIKKVIEEPVKKGEGIVQKSQEILAEDIAKSQMEKTKIETEK